MPESIPSKQSSRSRRTVCSTLLVSCLALPVMLALPACGDANSSQVDGAAGNASPGVGGGTIFVPVGSGGMGNGTAGGSNPNTGGSGPYMLPADYTKATM